MFSGLRYRNVNIDAMLAEFDKWFIEELESFCIGRDYNDIRKFSFMFRSIREFCAVSSDGNLHRVVERVNVFKMGWTKSWLSLRS
jgi:hypothetical protein